jgi:gluconolactonase
MRRLDLLRLLTSAALSALPGLFPTIALAQQSAPAAAIAATPPAPQMPPSLVPSKVVDLMTPEGSAIFGAQWKSAEAKIVEGPPIANAMPGYKTSYDIGAKGLSDRRGGGKVSFIWYRANLTIPAKVGDFDTAGSTVVLTAYVDDYAEVWVNGQIARRPGYPSPATIQGFNIPNRVVLSGAAMPGDKFQIAIFGINGPISVAPLNFVWFREAKIEFFH